MRDSATQHPSTVKTGPSSHSHEVPGSYGQLFEALVRDEGEFSQRVDMYEFIRVLGKGMQADVCLCRRWPTESERKAGVPPRLSALKVYDLHSQRRKSRMMSFLTNQHPIVEDETAEPPDHCEEVQQYIYGPSITYLPSVRTPGGTSTTTTSNTQRALCSNEDVKLIMREIDILKRVNHPNIVRLIEIIVHPDGSLLLVAMEYLEGNVVMVWDSFQDLYISPRTGSVLEPLLAASYTLQLFHALEYLHSCGIAHHDIKPNNLLITCDAKTLKVCDFGMSIMFDSKPLMGFMEYEMPPNMWCFRPPELCVDDKLLHTAAYDPCKSDVWAAAVCLYIFVFGSPPFFSMNPNVLFRQVKEDKLTFPVKDPDSILPHFESLMNDIANKYPDKRITAHAASNHPFFKVLTSGGGCVTNAHHGILFEDTSLENASMTMNSEWLGLPQSDVMPTTGLRGNLIESLARLRVTKEAELAHQVDSSRLLGMSALENVDDDGSDDSLTVTPKNLVLQSSFHSENGTQPPA